MAAERTLSIVKPDGVARNLIGEVLSRFEKAGKILEAERIKRRTRQDIAMIREFIFSR